MSRRLLVVAIASLPLVLSVGCGKKADLEAPEGEKNRYPRTYPKGAPEPRS